MKTSICIIACLIAATCALEVSYANYFDNDPTNDYPVLSNGAVRSPVAHPHARISYANFYDNNPYNDFPVLVENPAIAKVNPSVTTRHLSYANFLDNNPYNDFVVVEREPIVTPAWSSPVVSYENFYDANPFNDYAVIVDDFEEVNYRT